MNKDPYDPALGDFRLHNIGHIEAINGQPFDTHYTQTSLCETPSGFTSFSTPSSAALHLNAAWKAAWRAAASRSRIAWTHEPQRFAMHGSGTKAQRQVTDTSTEALFDFFEDAMIAASSSYYAIEAFCNVVIADKITVPYQVVRKGKPELYTLEEMEQKVSTDEKLKRVVPDLLGVSSPAGKAVWEGYRRMKTMRDSFTHFKRRDLANSRLEPTALHALLAMDPFEQPEAAMAVIGYFHQTAMAPRWLRNSAWKR